MTEPGAGLADGTLERRLGRRFRTEESTVETTAGEFTLLHPANPEELIDEREFDEDERLPYWADVWPSSTVLAGEVGGLAGDGRRLLELGCGLGLVASSAARAGFAVTATDYYEDALLFARVNAWRNAAAPIATRHVDWRAFPDDLGAFDLVVASDVLYERPYAELVADAFLRSLAPGGRGLLADPGRIAAGAFVEACGRRGLHAAVVRRAPFVCGEIRQTIDLYDIRRADAEPDAA